MKISHSQMAAMGWLHFIDRMIDLLRAGFPEKVAALTTEELQAGIREQGERAGKYGLVNEQDVAIFVLTAWFLGAGFGERIPAVTEKLNDASLTPGEKAQWLESFSRSLFEALER